MARRTRGLILAVLALGIVGFLILLRGEKNEEQAEGPQTRLTLMNAREPGRARAPRMAASSREESAEPSRQTEKPVKNSTAVIVRGTVKLPDGSPAPGASVKVLNLQDADNSSPRRLGDTKSHGDGTYRVSLAESPEKIAVQASADGMSSDEILLTVRPGSERVANLILSPVVGITGTVKDQDGQPIEGARVVAIKPPDENEVKNLEDWMRRLNAAQKKYTATSGPDGKFALSRLPSGQFVIVGIKKGFSPAQAKSDAPAENLELILESRGATLEGHVFLASTGEGLPDATIQIMKNAEKPSVSLLPVWQTESDSSGFFRVTGLSAGDYRISAEKGSLCLMPREGTNLSNVQIKGEETHLLDLYLYPGHTLTGHVVQKKPRAPIEGAIISSLSPPMRTTTSDANGAFRLEGAALEYGNWLAVSVTHPRYMSGPFGTDAIQVDASHESSSHIFWLDKLVEVVGEVVTEEGSPVAGANVSLESKTGRDETLSGADGGFRFNRIVAGEEPVELTASAPAQGATGLLRSVVSDDDTSFVRIAISPSAHISGIVKSSSGEPVGGAKIVEEEHKIEPLQTAEDGTFSAEVLANEALAIKVIQSDQFSKSKTHVLNLSPGERKSDIVIILPRLLYVKGRVIDGDGNPIPRAAAFHIESERENHYYNFRSQSNNEGQFSFGWPEGATGALQFGADGYRGKTMPNFQPDQNELVVTLEKVRPVTIIGSVIDSETNEPVMDFEAMSNAKSTNEGSGVIVLDNQGKTDRFFLTITAPGYQPLRISREPFPQDAEVVERVFRLQKLDGTASLE